jgi:WD40 repeat protein
LFKEAAMPDISACPDDSVLQELALGRMRPAEVEILARHCEQCPRCVQVLQFLRAEDTLTEAMAAQSTAQAPCCDAAVDSLIERLERLPLPVSVEVPMAATLVGGATPSGDAAAGAFVENIPAKDIALAPPQAPDEIGRLGGYRVLKMLGAGGMGVVYQAEDVQLQRAIALKVMKADVSRNPVNRERFLREARAAAKLRSDHVVNIYQVSEERQIVYLAMEFLEGISLHDLLKKGPKPTLAQAARIGRQIAQGLADAHSCGLIHRDIKPGNIWLDSRYQGRVKLLDFGLARGETEEVHLTQSGAIVGTPAFMAPEQARGENVDPRCDLFSLGVVLYLLTTGRLPFRGDNPMTILTSLVLDAPTPPREIDPMIPPRMAALIERLLAKDRKQRPATAKAVADELASIEREAAQPGPEERTLRIEAAESLSTRPMQPVRSRLRLGWLVAASLLLLLGGVVAAIVVIIRDKQGKEITRVNVPAGGSVEVKDGDQGKAESKVPSAPPKEEVRRAAAPLPPLLPGEPLSPLALVSRPAKLPDVRSWTIESRILKPPHCMAYRPDGKRLAVGTIDGRIHIWEPQSGRLVQVLLHDVRKAAVIRSLAWSPDGRILAAGLSGERPIRLWEAETGRPLAVPEALTPPIEFARMDLLAWSKDGQSVLAYSPPYSLAWDAADGKLRRKVEVANGPVPQTPTVLSPGGKRLWGTKPGSDGVFVWDMETGKDAGKLNGVKGIVRHLAGSPDGKHVAGVQNDGVHVWEVESGKEVLHRKVFDAYEGVWWSPDGRALAIKSPHPDHRVAVMEVAKGAKQQFLADVGHIHLFGAWSPDSKMIAASCGSEVGLRDTATGKLVRTLSTKIDEQIGAVQFALSPDGKILTLSDGSRTILSATDTGQPIAVLERGEGTFAHTWSPDGKTLAANQSDGTIILWKESGKVRVQLTGHHQTNSAVLSLAWSPDGKRLASSSPGEKRVLLWHVEKAERLRELGPFAAEARWVTWSPDARFLAFQVPSAGWHIWDLDKNRIANDPQRWQVPIFQFAPDGRSAVVATGENQPYRLRDLATGEDRGEPSSACACVCPDVQVVFSPDGRLLATPSWPSGIALLRSDLRGRVRTLKGILTPSHVQRYDFSRDGKLAAGLAGEYVQLWETDTGRLRGILLPSPYYNGLTLTSDGHYTGNEQVERGIVMVVQKDDGTQELLEPADFEQKYGFKNEPDKVHLLQPLPPPLYPQPGMPMAVNAVVREPVELPDANAMSWTIETVNARAQILAAAYRPDGKLLATGGFDNTIRIWDTTNGKLVRMLVGDPVGSLAWSRDGKLLAAGWHKNTVLWEVDTGRLLRRLPLGASGQQSLGWSPNENVLAALDGNGLLSLWDASAERVVRNCNFQQHGLAIAWSPDGKTLALGFQDKSIRLWDAASGKEVQKLTGHESANLCGIAWSPDGKRLVTTAFNEIKFLVWDAFGGKLLGNFPVQVPWNIPATLAWTPDGKSVAVGALGLFDPSTGRRLRSFDASDSRCLAAWSADFQQMATFGERGVHLYETSSGKRMHTLEEGTGNPQILTLGWSPDSRRLAVGGHYGRTTLRIVDAATGQRQSAPQDAFHVAAWSPDGRFLAAKGAENSLRTWDAVTLRPLRTMDFNGHGSSLPLAAMEWSPDGKLLAAGGDGHFSIWSGETGKELYWKDVGNFGALAWSPDGGRLAFSKWSGNSLRPEGSVFIWQRDNGKVQDVPLPAYRLAWSPDGRKLVISTGWEREGVGRYSLVLLDAASGKLLAKGPEINPEIAEAFHWSPDGKTFVTFNNKRFGPEAERFLGSIGVWDGERCVLLRSTPLPKLQEMQCAAWSPDGRVLACARDSQIYLFDASGQALGVLLPYDTFGQLTITAAGRFRGNARAERLIRMVVQKRDGSTETLTPAEFEQKYGFKNDPAKVRLIDR